jgi:hypothetical protein
LDNLKAVHDTGISLFQELPELEFWNFEFWENVKNENPEFRR